MKVAFIGAGSIGFTRKLLNDILAVPEFNDIEIAFTDINERNLKMVSSLVQRDIDANSCKAKLLFTLDRREALKNAKYVFNVVRIGGLDAFKFDIEIPLKYGIDQCVGDTLCAGGLMYAQRGIPALLSFCKDIQEFSDPEVTFFNYANPMAMNTWACNKYGGVKTIGLCHGVQHGQYQLAKVIELLYNEDRGFKQTDSKYRTLNSSDIDITCAGINHQTWYIKVLFDNKDWCSRLLEGFEKHPVYKNTEKVRIDMLRRFGFYSTESNGHLSEYLSWYRKRPNEIEKWIDTSDWANGETGGYLRHCIENRNWFDDQYPKWMNEAPVKFDYHKRSNEHGSYIVEALETGRVYRGHFNVQNRGIITNLPSDAIVEIPGYVDRTGINTPVVGEIPLGCAAVCNNSISVQRLGVEAAVHGDDELLRQAMMIDPLTGAVCNPPEIWQMVDEFLVAQEQWLPQYGKAVMQAKRRLASGNLIPTKNYNGAVRFQAKTADQLENHTI